MQGVFALTGAILFKFQPLGIIPLVFRRSVIPLLTLGTGETDYHSGFGFLGHF
jgi:hypothetical protein